MKEFEFGIKDGENQVKIFDIAEFIDDNRVHPKRIKATLKSKTNLDISSSIDINVVAPAIRSTEKEGEIQHKFLKTSDEQFLSIEGNIIIPEIESNLFTSDNYNLVTKDNYLLSIKR